MSMTDWFELPPERPADLTEGWSTTLRTAADLSRLRRTLAALVQRRSGPAGQDAALDPLLLIFEELASNGLRHGRPPVRVAVAATPTGWLLDVSDAATESPPVPPRDRDPATGGLGLSLVAALSAAHGWVLDGERKHVWAAIDVPSSAAHRSAGSLGAPRLAV